MKEFSKETIEIDGTEYTLFLNRKGIIAFEKFSKQEQEAVQGIDKKYDDLLKSMNIDVNNITDDVNPFEGIEDIDGMEQDIEITRKLYKKLYWIMLYENHKLSLNQVSELYDKACKEYREEDLIALGNQMIEDANKDKVSSEKARKNLAALRPQK